MKILSRGAAERIVVDDHIIVTVKSIEADSVVLALESTDNAFPYREETIRLGTGEESLPQSLIR